MLHLENLLIAYKYLIIIIIMNKLNSSLQDCFLPRGKKNLHVYLQLYLSMLCEMPLHKGLIISELCRSVGRKESKF